MNSIYFLVPFLVVALIGMSFDSVQAEPNQIKLQDSKNDYYFENGQLTKSVHGLFDRLLDYDDNLGNPVYVNYKQYDNGNNINFETGSSSFSFNKSTCTLNEYDGGHITQSSQVKRNLNHTMKQANNGFNNFQEHPSNLEPCTIQVQDKKIIVTKSNLSNSTNSGLSYDVIYDFNSDGSMEWTYDVTNTDPSLENHKIGFTFECNGAECNNILIDDKPVNIGETKLKDEIINKKIQIGNSNLDLKENQHGATSSLKKESNKITIDFFPETKLAINKRLIIDPVLSSTGSFKAVYDNLCNGTVTGTKATMYIQILNSNCHYSAVYFDLTEVGSGKTIISAILTYDVNSIVGAGDTGNIQSIEGNLSAMTNQQIQDDILDGTLFLDSSLNFQTVANDYTFSSASMVADIQNELDSLDYEWGVGFHGDDVTPTPDTLTDLGTNDVTLELTYTTTSNSGTITGLTFNKTSTLVIGNWTGCSFDGVNANTCTSITDVNLFTVNNNFPYAGMPLPDETKSDTEYGIISGSISMSSNEILFHFDESDINSETQDVSGSNNNATQINGGVPSPLTEEFTSATWVHANAKTSISGGKLNFDYSTGSDTDDDSAIRDITSVSDSKWVMRGEITFTDVTQGSNANIAIGISSTTGAYNTSQDFLGLIFRNTSGEVVAYAVSSNNAVIPYTSANKVDLTSISINTSYYYEIVRTGTGGLTVKIFSDSLFTIQIGSTATITFSDVTTLKYLKIANSMLSPATQVGTMEYMHVWDGVSTLSGGPALSFDTGLFSNSVSPFPLNFTSSDTLFEGTQTAQVGAFAKLNTTSDFNLLAYNVSGNSLPTEIGFNDTKQYVRYDGTDIASVDNDCNLFSWCFFGFDRSGSTFTFVQNGTIKGTNSSSQDLGLAENNEFFIGGNATLLENEILTGNLDEYYINDESDTSTILRISERGLIEPTFDQLLGNVTSVSFSVTDTVQTLKRVQLVNSYGNGTLSDLFFNVLPNYPDAIIDMIIAQIFGQSAVLSWTEPFLNTGNVSGYQINFTTPYGDPLSIITNNTGNSDITIVISDLNYDTQYSFRGTVITEIGKNTNGNIANGTTLPDTSITNSTPGSLDVDAINPLRINPISYTRTDAPDSGDDKNNSVLVNVTYPLSYDLNCNVDQKFANTNANYTSMNGTAMSGTEQQVSFNFTNPTNEVITLNCYDSVTGVGSTYVITNSDFVLLDLLADFRSGSFGTFMDYGGIDMITLIIIIISMIGFNRKDPLVGVIVNIIILGSAGWFGFIEVFTAMLGATVTVTMFIIFSKRAKIQ